MAKKFLDEQGLQTLLTQINPKFLKPNNIDEESGMYMEDDKLKIHTATISDNGLMSNTDKDKLDNLEDTEPITNQEISDLFS